jgi:hypothetical protein
MFQREAEPGRLGVVQPAGPAGYFAGVLIVARRVGTAHVMDAYFAGRRCLRAAAIIRTGDIS